MKGVGIVVVLLGVLGVVWLLARDVQSVTGERGGRAVVEPLQKAKEAADVANRSQQDLQNQLDNINR
jgi:hypothetical protein